MRAWVLRLCLTLLCLGSLGTKTCFALGRARSPAGSETSVARAGDARPPSVSAEALFVEESRRSALRGYQHWFSTLAVGQGLRFNNPYRLDRVLGSKAESLSLSALYTDLGLGVVFPLQGQLHHGGVLHLSVALQGIRQEVVAPSYLVLFRPRGAAAIGARVGAPIVLEPDYNLGFEAALLGVWRVLAGLGLHAELSYSLFAGAATRESFHTLIPILALQLGLWGSYEVLP